MNYMDVLIWVFFILSILLNIGLLYYIFRIVPKKAPLTQDAESILRDLTHGPVLLKVEYVNPSDFLLRSPRHL